MPQGPDWGALGRTGSRAVEKPTLAILIVSGALLVLAALATVSLGGVGAWVLRVVIAILAVPVVWLAIRRTRVLHRLGEMERTGEHPDNVVRTTGAEGQQIEILVPGAQQTLLPRLGMSGLAFLSFASLVSGGLAFGLLIIIGLSQLLG